jgi:protein-S-isoprenylcysteine O-methyltransferase Ste14
VNAEVGFRIAFWALLALVLGMRAYFAFQVRRAGERVMPDRAAVEREGRGMFAVRVVGFAFILALLVLYGIQHLWIQALNFRLPGWLRWVGFVIGLAGLGLWTWTQAALGAMWSAQLQLREQHHLVTTGPYARIRHPLYTAMCIWSTGVALVTANWIFVALAVMVVAGSCIRAPREEQMMIEQFGDEYREYIKRTGKFLPKWRLPM